MYDRPTFEKRFDRSFNRVYAYVLARVSDRTAAERITRQVMQRSLSSLLDTRDEDLDVELLRSTRRALREEVAARAPRAAAG